MVVNKFITATKSENIEIDSAGLLTNIEVESLLPIEDRMYKEWWWVCSDGYYSNRNLCVYTGGMIDYSGFHSYHDLYVRPILRLKNLNQYNFKVGDVFELGGYEFKIISNDLAWMHKQDIGKCCFKKNYKSKDSENYEKSDIKIFIDKWFKKLMDGVNNERV